MKKYLSLLLSALLLLTSMAGALSGLTFTAVAERKNADIAVRKTAENPALYCRSGFIG